MFQVFVVLQMLLRSVSRFFDRVVKRSLYVCSGHVKQIDLMNFTTKSPYLLFDWFRHVDASTRCLSVRVNVCANGLNQKPLDHIPACVPSFAISRCKFKDQSAKFKVSSDSYSAL